MKVLQLCLKPPYPKVDGGCMAMAAVTESLLLGKHSVKCFAMSTHKHPFKPELVPESILKGTKMEAQQIDTRVKPIAAMFNLFGSGSYNVERFYDRRVAKKLSDLLHEDSFDVVILESIFCGPYIETIRKESKAKVVLRAHNVEHQIWERLAEGEFNPAKKWYFKFLASRLKKYEKKALNKVDGILAITELDESAFRELGVNTAISVLPVGMDIKRFPVQRPVKVDLKLYHVGSMDWQPNIEGIDWFVEQIWPIINTNNPSIRCYLAGRKMPKYLLDSAGNGLYVSSEVDSVLEFVKDKQIAIVPLLSGSGMRVKIVEALALGKVVVSTTLGAAGIPFEHGRNMLIADSPEDFAAQIKFLTDNPNKLIDISKNARQLAMAEFDLQKLSSKLAYFCQHLS